MAQDYFDLNHFDLDSFDASQLDLNAPFNIGRVCTRPPIDAFDSEQIALIVDQSDEDSQTLSYSELNTRSNQFANALKSKGISKGDRVMLWLPNSIEFPICFFGALKMGAVAVPCSVMLTEKELAYLAKDSGAKLLVSTDDLLSQLSKGCFESSPLSDIIQVTSKEAKSAPTYQELATLISQASDSEVESPTTFNDPAYLVYTSGTTGFPKGVLHAHRALLGRIPAARDWFAYDAEQTDRILHSGKFNWTYVLGTALMDPLFLGKTVIVYEGESRADIWPKLIAKHSATIFIGVPTIYRQIIQKTAFTGADVPSLRHCMSAGEHLSDDMLHQWQQRFRQNIYEAIGMSECSYYLSQHPSRPLKPGSAGIPQRGHHIALLDADMNPVADNEEGMLCIHEDDIALFKEYWQLPDVSANAYRNGYFLTGDYATRDRDGYVWFLGRRDDIINSFGYRISPMEIERVMKGMADIADCVAIEETIAANKDIVTLCVILYHDACGSEGEIIDFATTHLAQYKVPKKVRFMESFPRTANGKILRKALKASIN